MSGCINGNDNFVLLKKLLCGTFVVVSSDLASSKCWGNCNLFSVTEKKLQMFYI